MTKKRILIVIAYILLLLIFLFYNEIHVPCIVKTFLKIPCPSCGMTRAFNAIIRLNFKQALSYNMLSIPLFIMLMSIFILNFIDMILNKNYVKKITNIIIKYYYILIILILINWIINIYKY